MRCGLAFIQWLELCELVRSDGSNPSAAVCLQLACLQRACLQLACFSCLVATRCLRFLNSLSAQGQGGAWGAGDLLFSFLGVVILSFGFKVYEQWPVMRRHAVEIVAATASSALFAMISTAGMARAAGLPPSIARGLVPRSGVWPSGPFRGCLGGSIQRLPALILLMQQSETNVARPVARGPRRVAILMCWFAPLS